MESLDFINSPNRNKRRYSFSKDEHKFEGFDFLRAVFTIAIIAYKTDLFYLPDLIMKSHLAYAFSAYALSGMVGAIAVPVFLQMSLFLFYYKSEKEGFSYFLKKRLPRLISLYLFWVGLITAFDVLLVGGTGTLRAATSSLKSFVEFVVSGNSTPYFFFFSLIFVTILAGTLALLLSSFKKTLSQRAIAVNTIAINYLFLLASLIVLLTFSLLDLITRHTEVQTPLLNFFNDLAHWDYTPFNFVPYVFTTAITAQQYKHGRLERVTKPIRLKLYLLLFLTIVFFILEIALTNNKFLIQVDQAPLDHYLRASLVFGSWFLLYAALLSKQKIPAIIRFISKCSLGIYGFHVFFTFGGIFALSKIPLLSNLFERLPVLEVFAAFTFTLFGSIALTLLFRRSRKLKRFVSV